MTFDSLPVIIVTAHTKTEADQIITEIMDDMDATSEVRPSGHASADRVWRLRNKYYSALVRVHARAGCEPPRRHAGPVGAHVLHLAPHELEGGAAERRLEAAAWLGPAAEVNVVACEAGHVPDALEALCARRRLEPVALRHVPAPGVPPFLGAELSGLPALRAALHAHTWPGLQRRAQPHQRSVAEPGPGSGGSSGGSGSEAEAEEEEEAGAEWELQSEGFARALGALSAGAAQAMRLQGSARRAAAEELVAAFAAVVSPARPRPSPAAAPRPGAEPAPDHQQEYFNGTHFA